MWPGSTASDSLETLSVLQVQNQAVGTQVHFVLGLRHLGVKEIMSEKFVDLSKKKKKKKTGFSIYHQKTKVLDKKVLLLHILTVFAMFWAARIFLSFK